MSTPILLLSTGTLWFGTARIPKALAAAGFEVALLAPRNSLAEKSRFVARIGHLPDNATAAQWVFALAAMIKAVSPRLLLPCDDMAFRLLCMVFFRPPPGLQPQLHAELCALIRESLGDPGYYEQSVDKVRLPPLAEALGAKVAAYEVIATSGEAMAFAGTHGYPVVLKGSHSTAGSGVWICGDADQVHRAFAEWRRQSAAGPEGDGAARLMVQAGVAGRRKFYNLVAWKGEALTGFASDALLTNPSPKGPATVSRFHRDAASRAAAARMVRGMGITGILTFEFIVDEATGERYLLEINRRVTPGIQRGARMGVDICAALLAAIEGRPLPTRAELDEDEEGINVNFPQEWLRDPASPWLRSHPVDVPWDEPDLLEAMLALRHLE